jgi:hypothetical protein
MQMASKARVLHYTELENLAEDEHSSLLGSLGPVFKLKEILLYYVISQVLKIVRPEFHLNLFLGFSEKIFETILLKIFYES